MDSAYITLFYSSLTTQNTIDRTWGAILELKDVLTWVQDVCVDKGPKIEPIPFIWATTPGALTLKYSNRTCQGHILTKTRVASCDA